MEEKFLLEITRSTDTHDRLKLGEELIEYFDKGGYRDHGFPDFGNLVGGLANWVEASSLQVNLMAMRILGIIVDIMKKDFHLYITTIFGPVMKRLGDAKSKNRQSAHCLLLQVLDECTDHPQALLERLLGYCLAHKNWLMKEQGMIFLVRTLHHFGVDKIDFQKYVHMICNLTTDINNKVRKSAEDTLVDIFRIVGEEVRTEIGKCGLDASRLKRLDRRLRNADFVYTTKTHLSRLQEFHELVSDSATGSTSGLSRKSSAEEGERLASQNSGKRGHTLPAAGLDTNKRILNKEDFQRRYADAVSTSSKSPSNKKGVSSKAESNASQNSYPASSNRKGSLPKSSEAAHQSTSSRAVPWESSGLGNRIDGHRSNKGDSSFLSLLKPPSDFSYHSPTRSRAKSVSPSRYDKISARSNSPGSVLGEDFEKIFDSVVEEQVHSKKELMNRLHSISVTLSNTELDWEHHMDALQQLRGIFQHLKNMNLTKLYTVALTAVEDSLIHSLKDPRSNIMRETCFTISYICSLLQSSAAIFGAVMLQNLIHHLSSSTGVFSSCADVCMAYIIKNCPSLIILKHLSLHGFHSKSGSIRCYSAKNLDLILSTYDITMLSKQTKLIEELLVIAIVDADATTRIYGRLAFWKYYGLLQSNAEKLFNGFNKEERKYLLIKKPDSLLLEEKSFANRKNQFMVEERQYTNDILSSASSESNTSFRKLGSYHDDHNSRLGSFLCIDDPRLAGSLHSPPTSPPSNHMKTHVRSVRVQTEVKHRNVGVQILKDSSTASAMVGVSSSSKEDDTAGVVEWDMKMLQGFIKETVEQLLAKYDERRAADDFERLKGMLDTSMERIIQKLDEGPIRTSTEAAVTSKRLLKDPHYTTPKLVPLELSYPSNHSLHSFAESDARGNLTPPPPSPNSSCSSLILPNDIYVHGSSSSRHFSTPTLGTTIETSATPSISVGHAENTATQSNYSTEIASTRVHPETPSTADDLEGTFLSETIMASSVGSSSHHQLSAPVGESFVPYANDGEAFNNNFVLLIPFHTDDKCCSYNRQHINKLSLTN